MKHFLLDNWLADILTEIPVRTNSLIITVFGDAIAPHGGAALLGGLIDLLAPLGISPRAVRTSVFRLAQEEWLHATPIGRRSVYSLTPSGQRRISLAYRRIYDTPHTPWGGEWQIVCVPDGAMPAKQREQLRRDLLWEGYGALAPNLFAHPSGDVVQLHEVLEQTDSAGQVAVFKAAALDGLVPAPVRTLVQQCWQLDQLAEDYRRFVERFSPALQWLASDKATNLQQSFVLRTLLIHEFRRIQLRDPQLPAPLLADDWPGHTARKLCRDIYTQALPQSEMHLLATLSVPEGRLPDADEDLYGRFGGLAKEAAFATRSRVSNAIEDGAPARNRTTT